jgi:hypothetical protein
MNNSLQPAEVESPAECLEQKRRKRNPSDKQANIPNKTEVKSGSVRDPRIQAELPTKNFFAPLRAKMELEGSKEKTNGGEQQEPTNQACRPPPINLTSVTNLLQLQKQLQGIVKGSFEFRNTKYGTRALTKKWQTSQPSNPSNSPGWRLEFILCSTP